MNKKIGIVAIGIVLICVIVLIPNLKEVIREKKTSGEEEKVITALAKSDQKLEFIHGNFSYRVMEWNETTMTGKVEVTGFVTGQKKMEIPSTVTGNRGSVYEVTALKAGLFLGNQEVEAIHIPETIRTIKKNCFTGSSKLKKITVSEKNPYYKVKDNTLFTKSGKTLVAVIDTGVYYLIPKGVTVIREGAFVYCKNLKEVRFPDTLKEIGSLFDNSCPKLTNIIFKGKKLPKFKKAENKVDLGVHKKLRITIPKGTKADYQEKLEKVYILSEASLKEDKNSDKKKVYLTFDDGPSQNTDEILEILDKYNAKATFFVLGRTDKQAIEDYRKIVKKGHTIGVHSTSHQYKKVYASLKSLKEDFTTTRDIVWKATGIKPMLYRFPGGSSNSFCKGKKIKKYINYFNDIGVEYVDWNASNEDANGRNYTPKQLVNNAIRTIEKAQSAPVVLMHDAAAKRKTVDALPGLLKKLNDLGYSCEALNEYVPPVHHR